MKRQTIQVFVICEKNGEAIQACKRMMWVYSDEEDATRVTDEKKGEIVRPGTLVLP